MEPDTGQNSTESRVKELHAYAKLLFLRSGRQFQDRTPYQELEEEEALTPEEPGNDGDSSRNTTLRGFDLDRLRREFLDRLSETVSSTKGGSHVTASYMFYWPDKVKIFIATNVGFVEEDILSKFLGRLCTALKNIAASPDGEGDGHTNALWSLLLEHQSPRLIKAIARLRQTMKGFPHLLPQHSSPNSARDGLPPDIDGSVLGVEDSLKLLGRFLFGDSGLEPEWHSGLVSMSHALYRTFPADNFDTLGRTGNKLYREIGFLGRLKTSFHVLVRASRQISGFEDLSLIPVPRLKAPKETIVEEWSLARTFQELKLQLSDKTITKLMGSTKTKAKWTQNKLRTDFSRLKSPTWEVHAEIQLIIFTLLHPEEVIGAKRFDYVGCSRYSCLLCSKFLQFFKTLTTRGCHGKLYNHSWTVPLGGNLATGERLLLSKTVVKLISWMREELTVDKVQSAPRRQEVQESTVGDSTLTMGENSLEDLAKTHAVAEYFRRQRAEISYIKSNNERPLDHIEHGEPTGIQTQRQEPSENLRRHCAGCYKVETNRPCSYCGMSLFCSESCELDMPLSHLLKCNMRQVTSADYLYEDAVKDKLPRDPKVRQDYWFDRCQNWNQESHLAGVFFGLLHYHPKPLTREELHKWRSDPGGDSYLVERIIERFEELPKSNRGEYFPWFLRHRAIFELPDGHRSIPQKPSVMQTQQYREDKARKYLPPEDQGKDVKDLTPFAKMHCFVFYSMNVDRSHPPPVNQDYCHWFDFGFVICRDEHEEGTLGSLYHTLMFGSAPHKEYEQSLGSSAMAEWIKKEPPACSFDEFWKAWEKGKLMALFEKCFPDQLSDDGFMYSRGNLLARLRAFLETEKPLTSVWRLRHFLALENTSVESATCGTAHAARKYGFSERLDKRTTMELKDFYVELFEKAEPLMIHRERMKVNLAQFAEAHVSTITPRVKIVLQGLL